jgi:putative nucleotidyltransferase with HDIG domain
VSVGSDIARARRRIAREAIENGAPTTGRTIVADLIVDELLDRIVEVADGSRPDDLDAWLEDAYDRHGDLAYLPVLLESTSMAVHEIGRTDGWLAAPLEPVTRALERALRVPRVANAVIAGDAIDELDVAINDLIARLFAKDVVTAEHSRAVSSWCARIARRLGLSAGEALLVQRGGLLHDIGKISVPDEILNAPRGLTVDERTIIQRHPLDGVDLVADLPALADFIPAIRDHHERLDGSGYPHGLKGERIPLAARLVSVADCFNAMVGRRPYRPPLSPYVAIRELSRHSGSHFDPEIVEALVAVVLSNGQPYV